MESLKLRNKKILHINLDPAISDIIPFANIDIRKDVNFKQVMSQNNLGPNGSIMICLNLYCLSFKDQVTKFLSSNTPDIVLIDTPGQMEVFTWSASGHLIVDMLKTLFSVVFVFVLDTPRSSTPSTFLSNMLYSCSIFYRFNVPLVAVFNKHDVVSEKCLAYEWHKDPESFQLSCSFIEGYSADLMQSLGNVLEEFFKIFKIFKVSSIKGIGLSEFIDYFMHDHVSIITKNIENIKLNIQN